MRDGETEEECDKTYGHRHQQRDGATKQSVIRRMEIPATDFALLTGAKRESILIDYPDIDILEYLARRSCLSLAQYVERYHWSGFRQS